MMRMFWGRSSDRKNYDDDDDVNVDDADNDDDDDDVLAQEQRWQKL